jgi:hypothetical protein
LATEKKGRVRDPEDKRMNERRARTDGEREKSGKKGEGNRE